MSTTNFTSSRIGIAALRAPAVAAVLALIAGMLTLPAAAAAAATEYPPVEIVTTTSDAGFVHPGVGLTADNLENTRTQVQAGVEPWASYYAAMSATNYASKTVVSANAGAQADLPASAAFDSQAIKDRLRTDGQVAMTQAFSYVITGDPVYRANALKLIRTWSNMDPARYAYFPDAHIHTGVPMYQLLMAAEVIRSTTPAQSTYNGYSLEWTTSDFTKLNANLIQPILTTFLARNDRYINQHNFGMVGSVAAAIFTDDAALYEQRVEWSTVNATFTGSDPLINGSIASTLREVPADDPDNTTGAAFVQNLEMGRDQAHAGADVINFTILARLMNNQGTLLDPTAGTVSTASDAVNPYEFLDRRILAGAEAMTSFMFGVDVPWVDLARTGLEISQAYRGRWNDPYDELYYQYRYGQGVDVEGVAPYVALAHERQSGPIYRNGTSVQNFWTHLYDGGQEYWLAFPEELADENVTVRTPSSTEDVSVARWGEPITGDITGSGDPDGGPLTVVPSPEGATLAVANLYWTDRSRPSRVGVRVRTDQASTLMISKTVDSVPYVTLQVPDTGGEWRYVTYDIAMSAVPASAVGDNIAYLHFVGGDDALPLDVESVTTNAVSLSPPVFDATTDDVAIGVRNELLSVRFPATDASGAPEYRIEGLPEGASFDPATAELRWTPESRQSGTDRITIVADDGTSVARLDATIVIGKNRKAALKATLNTGFDPEVVYTSASLAGFTSAKVAVEALLKEGEYSEFDQARAALRVAIRNLKLLNPRLADGTLDFSGIVVTTDLNSAAVATLTDGSNQSHWGDLRAPAVTFDFGSAYKVSASSFGIQARAMFSNRSQGTNVYGSNNGADWTLLTQHPSSPLSDYSMETIPVIAGLEDEAFRYLRLQIDERGPDTDPAYPGLWSIAEFRIGGERHEARSGISAVSLTSPTAVAGRVTTGDDAVLSFTSVSGITGVRVVIDGVEVPASAVDGRQWTATAHLGDATPDGRFIRFSIDHVLADGSQADGIYGTTDGTTLYASNAAGLFGLADAGTLVTATGAPDTAREAEAARLFDGVASTYTDTRPSGGVASLIWDLGAEGAIAVARADLLLRQDQYGPGRVDSMRLEGSNDLTTWTPVTSDVVATFAWQKLDGVASDQAFRYLRLRNNQIMGVAELRVFAAVAPAPDDQAPATDIRIE